jgi:hypothetical protein
VFVCVVGHTVLPASPDDVQPGAGECAYGVGVVVAAGSGALVKVGCPRVGVVRVAGEVGDGAAQLFVDGPPECDDLDFAGLAGGGCGARRTGQGLWGGEASTGIADLGEQAGGGYGCGTGQRGEDCRVGMVGELFGYLVVQGSDLLGDGFPCGDQGEGLSMSRNRPIAPGRVICRCARRWLAIAIRAAMRSLRARQVIRSDTVAGVSGVNG